MNKSDLINEVAKIVDTKKTAQEAVDYIGKGKIEYCLNQTVFLDFQRLEDNSFQDTPALGQVAFSRLHKKRPGTC